MSERFDLELFYELQEQYRERPVVKASHIVGTYDDEALISQAARRLEVLDERIGLRGRRVLEIGCGRGHTSKALAAHYDCDVVGVDIRSYDNWEQLTDDALDLRVHDVGTDDNSEIGTFDRVVSFAVWEHMLHPYASLRGLQDVLDVDGVAHFTANLYRGPRASHRYREVFFPWPHLLFDDEVVGAYYEREHDRSGVRSAWVNKLTVAHYMQYFRQLGLDVAHYAIDGRALDIEMYKRFHDVLGRYPVFDLESDFLVVDIVHEHSTTALTSERPLVAAVDPRVVDLERQLESITSSTSWRLTAPVRFVGDRAPAVRRALRPRR